MNDQICITTKDGRPLTVAQNKIRSPRSILLFTLDALLKRGNRWEIIQFIRQQGERLGLELGDYHIRQIHQDKDRN